MSFTYEFCMALTVWNEKLRILSKCSGQLGAVPCEDGEGRAQEGALRLQVQLRLLVGVEVCQRNEPRAAACTASEHHLGRARGLCGHCSHFPAHDAVAPHAVHLADVVLQLVQRQQLVAVVHHLALAGVHHYGHARWSRQLQGPRQTQTVHRHVAGQQQTGLGRHSHLVRLGESRLQFVWKQREGRVKHNPRAGNSGDAEESLRGRRGHVRTCSHSTIPLLVNRQHPPTITLPSRRSSSAYTVSWSDSAVKADPAGMPALTDSAASRELFLQGE
mmetsp:Transcript_2457/g.3792  ORF Transcript_2457/g.3792 Transcript_2457/m.3792 type:complete len:274 (+) Transcript_2457:1655-2476(+)